MSIMKIVINGENYYLKQSCKEREGADKLVEILKIYGHKDAVVIENKDNVYPYGVFATRYNRCYVYREKVEEIIKHRTGVSINEGNE